LEASDVLLVTRLDRLARSTRDLLNILDAIAKAGAGFKSLKDAWADTTTPHGRLMLTVRLVPEERPHRSEAKIPVGRNCSSTRAFHR
jgi:DNA invertase Pin-like site-specific DNA recombinase